MKNSIFLWKGLMTCALALFFFVASAQIPDGYYSGTDGKSGDELKSTLYHIIKGHTQYPYTSSSTDVWDILKETDKDPNNPNNVIGIYSNFSMNAAAEYNSGDGWSREHVWAKSRGDFGTSAGPGTDVHHLRAADISTNSARGNRTFAECAQQYTDAAGTYNGATESFTSSTAYVWKPRAAVKGDIARMIFYMATRYEGFNGEPDLEIVDYILDASDKSPLHGKLSDLLAWHNEDPVDDWEKQRNDIIYSYQQNRNPFIDHPEFVALIWGGTTTEPAPSFTSTPTTTTIANELYTYNITTTGGEGALTITATQKPAWVTFTDNGDGTAILTGTPTNVGNHAINLDVTDGTSTASQPYTLIVSAGTTGGDATTLFISEYIEGSSYNKAIEIANFTGDEVDLSAYTLHKQANGAGSWSTGLALNGTLAHGDVFVVAHTSASAEILAQADLITGSAEMTFNGNDPIALFKEGTLLDMLGVFNEVSVFAQDVTMVRNSSITAPNGTYNTAEWDSYASDTFTYIGSHTVEETTPPNELPTVSVTAPTDNSTFTEGDIITITAVASDSDGSISKVAFYEGGNLLDEDFSSPYTFDWADAGVGSYSITVVAFDNENASTTSSIINVSVEAAAQELFISEYIEGSSYNKALEIANFTGTNVELSAYTIHKQTNGAGSWSTGLALTGTLAHGDVFVVAHTSASAEILAQADLITGSAEMTFNGNDPIALFKEGTLLDILGVFNDASVFAQDVTMVRNSSISAPNGTYNPAEWDNHASDTFTYLGAHAEGGAAPSNELPSVSITSPGDNSTFTEGDVISIEVTASDSDGSISKVLFYQGNNLLGEDLSSPYTLDWSNAPVGTYSITAMAFDNDDATTTSSAVNISVEAAPVNIPPTVSVTNPLNGALFTEGNNITIEASASDTDGSVAKVVFYEGNNILGEDLSSPYAFEWSNASAGSYTLTAVAYDDQNTATTSSAINISVEAAPVNSPPIISMTNPIDGGVFTEGTNIIIAASASDSDGAVAKVEFFSNGTKIGEDFSSPYSISLLNPSVGTYELTAVAIDNEGAITKSSPISVTVEAASATPTMVSTIYLNTVSKGKNYEGEALINITSDGVNLVGAYVEITWRNNFGYYERQGGYTGSYGILFISSKLRQNNFNITIDYVIKAGYDWDKINSELTKSNTSNTRVAGEEQMTFYPNPFQGATKIKFHATEFSNVAIHVYNMKGEKLENHSYSVNDGAYEYTIGTDLPKGIYMVQLLVNESLETFRIVKE